MRVAVIGAGSWGTALAQVLGANGHDVSLWARKDEVVQGINSCHRNPRYLVDSQLSENITATTSVASAVEGARAVVVVTPSSIMRTVAKRLATCVGGDVPVVLCSKGVEEGTGEIGAQIFAEEMGGASRIAVLSGPNHAEEVIKSVPTGTVIASSSATTASFFQDLFACDSFRTYVSNDVLGVELCAAFKNVIAISVGVSYGLGFGDNTAALLMTRGMAEMSRLVVKCGGQAITCMGLAGAGDLIATCTSRHSRNRSFGEELASGGTLDAFRERTHMVVEGALACKTLQVLANKYEVELPITQIVRSVVWDGANARTAARELTQRSLKSEFYGL